MPLAFHAPRRLSVPLICRVFSFFFFFNDTATTEIYTLSLHDALPIYRDRRRRAVARPGDRQRRAVALGRRRRDRKSTRLNSSHGYISYAVFCLKKKKNEHMLTPGREQPDHPE